MGGKVSFPVVELPRERIVVVTGGNTGLGYEIAKWTAMMGATVIIACRSEQRATEAIEKMKSEYTDQKSKWCDGPIKVYPDLAVEFMGLDLASFKSTLAFTEAFKRSGRQLHVLVCNAGVAMIPFEKTEDGFEKMLQVNYLSHFLLVAKLLPLMRTSGDDCRILLMSSDAHRMGRCDLNTMNYSGRPQDFRRMEYYGRSKLYQIMQMFCMARRLQGTSVTINSSHPGVVDTEVRRGFSDLFFWNTVFDKLSRLTGKMKTPIEGATSVINGAVNPALAGVSQQYFIDCKDGYKTPEARNTEKQELLWKRTLEYLKEHISDEELRCLEGHS